MKRISFWALSTVTTLVLLFGYHTSTSGPMATSTPTVFAATAPSDGSTSSDPGSSSGSDSGSSSGSGSGSASDSGSGSGSDTQSTSTTATGSVAMTRWGPVQVELTVESGTITEVSVVQYPNGNHEDQEINSYALPILTQETIDAQSASIDMVSGATVTSLGYLQSLQSALDQADL